jgi:hypothetical protein
MTCERRGEQLSALMDGEMGAVGGWLLRRHARGCARCRAELAALRAARAAVGRRAEEAVGRGEGPLAPPAGRVGRVGGSPPQEAGTTEFWEAVRRRLDAVDARPGPAVRQRWALRAVGAALALLAVLGALAAFVARRPAPVTAEWVARQHARRLVAAVDWPRAGGGAAARLTASPSDAAGWLETRLGRRVPPVDLELVGLELQGSLAWEEGGRPVGLLRYARGPERWSLLVLPGGELAEGHDVIVDRQPFREAVAPTARMAAWHASGCLFLLAGPAPEPELLRVARQASRACEIGR